MNPRDPNPHARFDRRTVLRAAGLATVAVAAPGTVSACSDGSTAPGTGTTGPTVVSAGRVLAGTAPLPEPFRVPLPVPRVARPVRRDTDTDHYEIVQRPADAEILPGLRTPLWTYDGTFPGPTIESRRGRRTVVTHVNELPVPTVVHLHGGRTAPEHDGYPTDLTLPRGGGRYTAHGARSGMHGPFAVGRREHVYELDQPAATLWYHDHRMDFTGPAVWRGLAGFHLHRDDVEDALGLPSGDREVPLMICDRSFAADGTMPYPSLDPTLTERPGVEEDYAEGVLGDVVLVNGAPWPVLDVAATTYRLRILNASNARRYTLRLDDGRPMTQIGSDLGLLAGPVRHPRISIAQAERFDVVVDFSGHAVGDGITMVDDRDDDAGGTTPVMRFRVVREPGPDETPRPLPSRLAEVERLSPADAVTVRDIRLDRRTEGPTTMWTVNGAPFTPDTVVARPRLGTVERWIIRGQDAPHPFHIHLAPFQVVTRGTNPPGPYDGGWKDTVSLDEGFRVEFLIRFDGHRGRYVFHCHNLEHEDMMMMANVEVV